LISNLNFFIMQKLRVDIEFKFSIIQKKNLRESPRIRYSGLHAASLIGRRGESERGSKCGGKE